MSRFGCRSAGRTLTEQDGELQRIDRNGVVVDGRKLFFGLPGPRAESGPPDEAVLRSRDVGGSQTAVTADSEAETTKKRVAAMLEGATSDPTGSNAAPSLGQKQRVTPEVAERVFARPPQVTGSR